MIICPCRDIICTKSGRVLRSPFGLSAVVVHDRTHFTQVLVEVAQNLPVVARSTLGHLVSILLVERAVHVALNAVHRRLDVIDVVLLDVVHVHAVRFGVKVIGEGQQVATLVLIGEATLRREGGLARRRKLHCKRVVL